MISRHGQICEWMAAGPSGRGPFIQTRLIHSEGQEAPLET
jgi:hypothetical protein